MLYLSPIFILQYNLNVSLLPFHLHQYPTSLLSFPSLFLLRVSGQSPDRSSLALFVSSSFLSSPFFSTIPLIVPSVEIRMVQHYNLVSYIIFVSFFSKLSFCLHLFMRLTKILSIPCFFPTFVYSTFNPTLTPSFTFNPQLSLRPAKPFSHLISHQTIFVIWGPSIIHDIIPSTVTTSFIKIPQFFPYKHLPLSPPLAPTSIIVSQTNIFMIRFAFGIFYFFSFLSLFYSTSHFFCQSFLPISSPSDRH